jgi:hypothetical protein
LAAGNRVSSTHNVYTRHFHEMKSHKIVQPPATLVVFGVYTSHLFICQIMY